MLHTDTPMTPYTTRLTIIAVLLLFCVAVPLPGAHAAEPEVFLPTDRHEFGTVVEGTIVQHDFIIQNRGAALLEILKVVPG